MNFGRIFDRTLGRLFAKLASGGRLPIQVNWQRNFAWERTHSNSAQILESDPHAERVKEIERRENLAEDEAFRLWLSLACEGSTYSMNKVAYCYESGRGVGCDLAEAERWYAEAFARGSQTAALRCAHRMFSRGDHRASIATLQNGVAHEWPPALFWQAWYRLKQSDDFQTHKTIRPLLETASDAGHPAAQWFLARLMARGVYGPENRARGWQRLMHLATEVSEEAERSR